MSLEDELQNLPTNQTFQVSKQRHHCHPNAGDNAIYIDNSADAVGIGTVAPPKTLTVAGDIREVLRNIIEMFLHLYF